MANFRGKDLPIHLPETLTNPLGIPDEVGEALEHAHDPGADPALRVLERALLDAWTRLDMLQWKLDEPRQMKLL